MSSAEETRFAQLAAGVSRGDAFNDTTRISAVLSVLNRRRPSCEEVFRDVQAKMARIHADFARPGLLVFAAEDTQGLAGHLWLEASASLRGGSVGRHGAADLHLPGDSALSLRHLLVLVRGGAEALRIRVLDLRTPGGFTSEEGQLLAAVEFDGFAILRAGAHWLFFVPTGGRLPWDARAAEPWDTLPERALKNPRVREVVPRLRLVGGARTSVTNIAAIPGPFSSSEPLCAEGEAVVARLRISGAEHAVLPIGASALERGVLLGRDERCDGRGIFQDNGISRVHALIVREGAEVHLLDVGSMNGTWEGEEEIRARRLEEGVQLRLAMSTQIAWSMGEGDSGRTGR
jgi:hypothetical protein